MLVEEKLCCQECNKEFDTQEPAYRIGYGEYLCEKCHQKLYTERAWLIEIIQSDHDCTDEKMESKTDEELAELANYVLEFGDPECYYTEIE